MTKLAELLEIVDRWERQRALVDYAQALGVNYNQAKNHLGELIEEKLVLMIFDAMANKKTYQSKDLKVLVIVLGIGVVVMFMIASVPRLITGLAEDEKLKEQARQKSMKCYDEKGQVLMDSNEQPVKFKMMHGEYEEFSEEGWLKYEYVYDNGKMIKRIEYNRAGIQISEKTFE